MKENWYALFMAIQKNITVQDALREMNIQTKRYRAPHEDVIKMGTKMLRLQKKGYSIREIAKMYGICYSTARNRIISTRKVKI